MDISIFGDKVDNTVLLRHLHSHREVISGFSWEENVSLSFGKWLVSCCRCANFDDVKLATSGASDRETEEIGFCIISFGFELSESGGVTFDRLTNFTFDLNRGVKIILQEKKH